MNDGVDAVEADAVGWSHRVSRLVELVVRRDDAADEQNRHEACDHARARDVLNQRRTV